MFNNKLKINIKYVLIMNTGIKYRRNRAISSDRKT